MRFVQKLLKNWLFGGQKRKLRKLNESNNNSSFFLFQKHCVDLFPREYRSKPGDLIESYVSSFPSAWNTKKVGVSLYLYKLSKVIKIRYHTDMTRRSNKDIFVRGFAKALEEQWQVDVRLKAMDSDEGSAIFAHKLILV